MSLVHFGPDGVRQTVSMREAISAVRTAFMQLADGDFEMPIRTVLCDGGFLIMSVHHRSTRSAMVKTLSLNFESRAPAIMGTVNWTSLDKTHQVVADAAAVTALRTGAVTGAATDLLARADATTCAVIGAGAQGADQARGVLAVRPIRLLEVVDTDEARARELCRQLAREFGEELELRFGVDTDKAVEGKDIVCCATTAREPLFSPGVLAEQVHINAIGAFRPSMREIADEILARSVVVVDDKEAVIQESGEIISALSSGAIMESDLIELGAALQTPRPADGWTVFKSVGVAIQDWAIANLLARRVEDREAQNRQVGGPGTANTAP